LILLTSTKKREEGKMKKNKENKKTEKSGKKVRTQIRAGMNKAELIDAIAGKADLTR
jgi:hypothetical protein